MTNHGQRIGFISLSLVLVSIIAGIAYGLYSPSTKVFEENEVLRRLSELTGFWQMIAIYINNLSVLLLLYASSLIIIPGLLILFSNGYTIGSVAVIAAKHVGWTETLLLLLPHGVIELYAFIYAAYTATSVPISLALKKRKRVEITPEDQMRRILYASLVLFIAAFIEAFITPSIASLITS